jgi:hypothetical protein
VEALQARLGRDEHGDRLTLFDAKGNPGHVLRFGDHGELLIELGDTFRLEGWPNAGGRIFIGHPESDVHADLKVDVHTSELELQARPGEWEGRSTAMLRADGDGGHHVLGIIRIAGDEEDRGSTIEAHALIDGSRTTLWGDGEDRALDLECTRDGQTGVRVTHDRQQRPAA